jgi:hypothetical protein
MSQPDDPLDDLAQACRQAPAHGLNAKTLILQAALQQDDEPQEETARKRRRRQGAPRRAATASWASPILPPCLHSNRYS